MEIREILEITRMLFPDFDEKKFHSLSDALQIADGSDGDAMQKKICTLSEGTLVKLMLALTLSRQTDPPGWRGWRDGEGGGIEKEDRNKAGRNREIGRAHV